MESEKQFENFADEERNDEKGERGEKETFWPKIQLNESIFQRNSLSDNWNKMRKLFVYFQRAQFALFHCYFQQMA